ncbi:hypothetical protein PIB30_022680 [Stylosanthes scabra]|uniref:TIR domain-containing protein n=1 Tax=Stylosanthes scabra TaxID=79078 RepID=A0ABU6W9A2_9FABA|nr:hypothetical protein [Stylosanthes scabra]
MPTSSSSSPPPPHHHFKYDIFISFRGSDTRRGFLSHLLTALSQNKIDAYVDYKLKEGNEILPALFTAIEESQIALIIFSDDYASSKWCLKELVKITECQKEKGQIVIPIFYNVEPSQVRHQKRSYAEAFIEYENNSKDDADKWRTSLKGVANLSGFHSKNFGSEALLIKNVVKRILETLDDLQPTDVLQGLVGIDKPLKDLKSLVLANGSKDVRVIGIWGMGGIGKTTIANALFLSLRSEYESGCILANVREQIEKYGMLELRNKLHCILLEDKDLDPGVPNVALAHVLRRLRRKKILVVLDDVINPDQVRELVGGRGQYGWLGLGSRIIVTTRDKHVLRKEADDIYEVKALGFDEALQLLTLHAFNGKSIQMGYHCLMVEVAKYAKGVPLALKVLGSFLYGKSVEEWRSQLDKLQKMPFEGIQKVLRLSYDGLDRHEQKILLYIVCFFQCGAVLHGLEDAKMLLDACGFSPTIALRTLEDRSLITRDFSRGVYEVHDLIQQMCQEIVCEAKIGKPGERHHLWDPNDIYHVLKYDKGTESIESISLDISKINDLNLSPYSLFLLHWDFYPFKYLQPAGLENLVQLRMEWSRLEKLWDGTQNLPSLRKVNLSHSKQLREVPDLSKALRLEELNLESCENLVSVHTSVFSLPKLVKLYMRNCKRLKRLPGVLCEEASASASPPSALSSSPNLRYLDLTGCVSLKHLPDTFYKLTSLKRLDLSWCKELDTSNLHILFDGLSSLRWLAMDGCHKLHEVPDNIINLSLLEWLSLDDTNVKNMPESIKHLPHLNRLCYDGPLVKPIRMS